MKKGIFTLIAALLSFSISFSQTFVSGSFGINHLIEDANVNDPINKQSTSFSFGLSPKVGHWINNNLALGGLANIGYSHITTPTIKTQDLSYGLGVFARNKLYTLGNFKLYMESPLNYSHTIQKTASGNETEYTKSSATNTIALNAYPLLEYALTEKFLLLITPNFLNLGVSYATTQYPDQNVKKQKINYSLGGKTTLFNFLGDISIGFSYSLPQLSKE